MSNLHAYLAKNYLSAIPASSPLYKKKKKKLKHPANSTTRVVDEDADDWKPSKNSTSRKYAADDDDDDMNPLVVEEEAPSASSFKTSNWTILDNGDDGEVERAERKQESAPSYLANQDGREAETIYRHKSGKKVDLAAERAELLAQRRKREAEEEKQMEWGRGLVQSREKEESTRRMEKERAAPLAVYKDDVEYNDMLKERDRWGDPMAGLIKKPVNKKEHPKYKGPWAPNRFNIPPGYRWDGVDRGNGFENKMFLSKNAKVARADAAYQWSTEDM